MRAVLLFLAVTACSVQADDWDSTLDATLDATLDDLDDDLDDETAEDDAVELADGVGIHVLPGWCHRNTGESVRMTGQQTYFTGSNVTQASCIARCNEDSNCHQAVFEASGPWGPQCWLGNQTSDARPTDSRPCSG